MENENRQSQSDIERSRSDIPASLSQESQSIARLDSWLAELVSYSGSDLLLVAGAPPCMLCRGKVRRIEDGILCGKEIEAAVIPALTAHALKVYRERRIADSSYRVANLGRFRINLHQQKGEPAAAIRALPTRIPVFSELRLPESVHKLAYLSRGLVLIGGPAGSGKSTTLAALVHEINTSSSRHIVVIEDPIEYEHRHLDSIIEQIEIGTDAPDFPTALRAALRQAPDVLVVGEMRDPETMQIAVAAAETGHLVFSTVHTTDSAATISRVANSFPLERQNTIRQELAMALAAILNQMLLPSPKGGRVPACELLMIGYAARQHIRRNALQHLTQEIALSRNKGSFSLEETLVRLVAEGHITTEDALEYAMHPEDLSSLMKDSRHPST